MHVSLTEHAERRMQERSLGLPHLLAVLSSGVAMPNGNGRIQHRLEDLCVISSRCRDTLHIITFYRMQAKQAAKPKRPLAMARTRTMARKHGFRDPNLKRKLKSGHIHYLWPAA
ncbi:DUF4258 domain-containing protein [Desulfobotulus sp. H1]|uniref:DUF4258 domain-containing protein n=1 Tax=Desulfobotulus pelophilus TaxID=2823377 RepID=A0ABT3NDE6_9BACT|nr:DUF4258 domain-containing protein [Desulfobotulus pelophilus]MCW7755480.1 DUF4258 domain-containing protein [Desulfobotulus pelophilus]